MKNICKKTITFSIILLLIGVSVSSAYSNIKSKGLKDNNHPPNPPRIIGEPIPKVGCEYEYCFITTDPEGQNVSYYVEWGDGTSDGWSFYYPSGEIMSYKHTWDKVDWDNNIRCKAKDIYGKESDWNESVRPIMKSRDCNCKEIDSRHLIRLEKQLNRLEVYTKLLLVLSRYNPELREISEELSNEITILKEELTDDPPFPILCKIFWGLYRGLTPIVILIQTLYEYFPNLREIIYNIAYIIVLNYYIIQFLAFGFCGLFPYYP